MARIAELPRDEGKLADMVERGYRQAALYSEAALAPRWEDAIDRVLRGVPAPRDDGELGDEDRELESLETIQEHQEAF
jgi:hypothetical protein